MKLIDCCRYVLKWIWVFIVVFVLVTGVGLGIVLVKNNETVTKTSMGIVFELPSDTKVEQVENIIDKEIYKWSTPDFYDKVIDQIVAPSENNIFNKKLTPNKELAQSLRENKSYFSENLCFVKHTDSSAVEVVINGGGQDEMSIILAVANVINESAKEDKLDTNLDFIEPVSKTVPVDFNGKLVVLLSAVMGVLLGLFGCYIAQQVSPKLLSANQVRENFDIPLIGECYMDGKEDNNGTK